MPNRYVKSRKADRDINSIYHYSAREFGERQTDKYLKGLENKLQQLSNNTQLGKACDWLIEGYRRLDYEGHVIYYRQRKNDIFIVRILHQRQDPLRHISGYD